MSPSAVIIHRDVLRGVGGFDESLPACEDYDLWLRIGCRYPIGLVDEPLVVKRGGHADQRSATIPSLDRYRIQALANLLRTAPLDDEQRQRTLEALKRKCRIYGLGCMKRGRREEAEQIMSLPARKSRPKWGWKQPMDERNRIDSINHRTGSLLIRSCHNMGMKST